MQTREKNDPQKRKTVAQPDVRPERLDGLFSPRLPDGLQQQLQERREDPPRKQGKTQGPLNPHLETHLGEDQLQENPRVGPRNAHLEGILGDEDTLRHPGVMEMGMNMDEATERPTAQFIQRVQARLGADGPGISQLAQGDIVGAQEASRRDTRRLLDHERAEAAEGGLVDPEIEEGRPITLQPKADPPEMPESPPLEDESPADTTQQDASTAEASMEPAALQEKAAENVESAAGGGQAQTGAKSAEAETTRLEAEAAEGQEQTLAAPETPSAKAELHAATANAPASPEAPEAETEEEADEEEAAVPERERHRLAASLASALRTEGTEKSAQLRLLAQDRQAALRGTIGSQIASIQAGTAARIAQVQAQFAAWRDQLTAHAAQQTAAAATQLQAQQLQVETSTQAKVDETVQALTQKRTQFGEYIVQQKELLVTMANGEADRADNELESAAQQAIADTNAVAARYPGSDDPAPRQRTAAQNVGQDAAREIRSKKPSIRTELVGKAREFGQKYNEYRDRVFQQIDDTQGEVATALMQTKAETLADLQSNYEATLERIESQLQAGLELLGSMEQTQVQALEAKRDRAVEGLQQVEQESVPLLAETAQMFADGIEQEANAKAEALESGSQGPKALERKSTHAREDLATKLAGASEQVEALATQTQSSVDEAYRNWETESTAAVQTALAQGQQQYTTGTQNIDQAITLQNQAAQQILDGLAQRHAAIVSQILAQVDTAIAEARQKVDELRDQFRQDVRKGADDSIREAKKPLTDQASTRAQTSADRVAEPWWRGALRALRDIAIGLLVVVVLAVLVVAIAAALGFSMTLMTAMLAIGVAFLALALIAAIIRRGMEVAAGASPWRLLMVFPDAIGLTTAIEGFRGRELFTNRELSPGESWYRAITGTVQVIGTAFLALGFRGGGFRIPTRFTTPRQLVGGPLGRTVGGFLRNQLSNIFSMGTARAIGRGISRFITSVGESVVAIGRGIAAAAGWLRKLPGRVAGWIGDLINRARGGNRTPAQPTEPVRDPAEPQQEEVPLRPRDPRAIAIQAEVEAAGLKYLLEVEDAALGAELGSGAYKTTSTLPQHPGRVAGVLNEGNPTSMVIEEVQLLNQLAADGFPTTRIHGITSINGRPAVIMDQYVGNLKPFGFGGADNPNILNQNTLRSLLRIRDLIDQRRARIDDLQFLIDEQGNAVIADPLGYEPNSPYASVPAANQAISATMQAIVQRGMVRGRPYTEAEIRAMLEEPVPDGDWTDFFNMARHDRAGFLQETGDGHYVYPPE